MTKTTRRSAARSVLRIRLLLPLRILRQLLHLLAQLLGFPPQLLFLPALLQSLLLVRFAQLTPAVFGPASAAFESVVDRLLLVARRRIIRLPGLVLILGRIQLEIEHPREIALRSAAARSASAALLSERDLNVAEHALPLEAAIAKPSAPAEAHRAICRVSAALPRRSFQTKPASSVSRNSWNSELRCRKLAISHPFGQRLCLFPKLRFDLREKSRALLHRGAIWIAVSQLDSRSLR